MRRTNAEIRKTARTALDGQWGKGILAYVVYLLVVAPVPSIASLLYPEDMEIQAVLSLWALLCIPLIWGFRVFFLRVIRNEQPSLGGLFGGYKDFVRIFVTVLLQGVFIALWSLLFIVPGIIKALSYSMTSYILHDHPDLKYNGAINESMRLMRGCKMKLFVLFLSFIGWSLLCLLTLGLGFFLLIPYIQTSLAAFYQDLINDDVAAILEVEDC